MVAAPIGLDEEQNAVVDGFGTLKARTEGGGFEGCVAHPITFGAQMSVPQTDVDLVQTLQAKNPMAVAHAFKIRGGVEREDGSRGSTNIGKQAGKGYLGSDELAFTVASSPDQYLAHSIGTDCYNGAITGDVAATIGTPGSSVNASGPTVMTAMQVRRLTPTECERLQGFPDGFTNIPWRKKPEAPDGPRYKALGNSMAVPCMRWLGERIQAATARQESP
jgi:site-specific DNA-cytosine methylase